MQTSKTETDIILNRANVALARSQRLVASWLPAVTAEEQANAKSEQESQREEDEIFTAVPETLGIGAPLPSKAADGSWNRTELDSNDKLRKQLLGKNSKVMAAARQTGKTVTSSKSRTQSTMREQEEHSDDDDEGRTTLVNKKGNTKKRKVDPGSDAPGNYDLDGQDVQKTEAESSGSKSISPAGGSSRRELVSKGRKKANSFLDELLADRSKKRKKR